MNIAELALKNLAVGEHVSYIFEEREITNVQMDRAAVGQAVIKPGSIGKPMKGMETRQVICDGWLHTGDIGYVDADGYFYITDQKKILSLREAKTFLPAPLKKFFMPKEVVILPAMPKTLVGKILKKELRKL